MVALSSDVLEEIMLKILKGVGRAGIWPEETFYVTIIVEIHQVQLQNWSSNSYFKVIILVVFTIWNCPK